MPRSGRRRYALVGAGARAEMFVRAIALDHADRAELVGLADVNQTRMAAHNRWLTEAGHPTVPTYHLGTPHGWGSDPTAFVAMLEKEAAEVAVVTTIDRAHDEYIVAALDAGRDVITEKPMTTDAVKAQRIIDAVRRTGRSVTVAFNYRYNPLHSAVREALAAGEIGEVGSVHFEWLLDVRHGADYFRRWHRDRANSGGLLVHKSGHHFDLVNWWLGAEPVEVFGFGELFFYGEQGRRHGHDRGYERAHGNRDAADDPFAIRLADNPRLRELYLDAESEDGYRRDQNVFAPGVSIEDDVALVVKYAPSSRSAAAATGATMTYHLTAYAPWEGYRVMFNGSRGRLELEVVESDFVSPQAASALKGAAIHGVGSAAENGSTTLTVRPFWAPPRQIPVTGHTRTGHGGADTRMCRVLFGGETDPLDRGATERDGALALLTGLAANQAFETGRPVRVADLIDLT